jgi:release factor glutamine methyltransferase
VTIGEALAETTERLADAGCESPRVDAEILLAHVLGVSRSELLLETPRELSSDQAAQLGQLVERRALREPLAYVLGEWDFRGLRLSVDSRVLVPRPETEVVVERCLERLDGVAAPRVLDVGTGSGAIALAIARAYPGSRVTGIDSSAGALEVAGANVLQTGIEVELRLWDIFQGLPEGPWDLVVANPPYVLPEEIDSLEPEVRDWEPREALVGVGATEAVARAALDVLQPNRALVLEVAAADAERVASLLRELGYVDVATTPDLAGRDRVVEGVTTSAD